MPFAGEFIFRVRSWRRIVRFAGFATAALISPSTYQPATRELAVRQIYYTACQVLFGYLLFAGLLSLVVIEIVFTMAGRYGLAPYSLELMLRVLVLEILPLLTALFVALRSGAAIGAEIALMTVKGEIQDSEEAGQSPLHAELVPRIAGAALSVLSLTTLSCALATALAYIALYGFSAVGEDEFSLVVANVFVPHILMGLILKCLLFGLVVALIPVATGLEAERDNLGSAPNAVLGGLVKLFFVIGVIQILSLVAKYI